jgi:hypothetical protein
MTTNANNRVMNELLETAADLRDAGLMSEGDYAEVGRLHRPNQEADTTPSPPDVPR